MSAQKVLVVDDEAPMRKYISTNLKARGYDVLMAEDGTEAEALTERHEHSRGGEDYHRLAIDGEIGAFRRHLVPRSTPRRASHARSSHRSIAESSRN